MSGKADPTAVTRLRTDHTSAPTFTDVAALRWPTLKHTSSTGKPIESLQDPLITDSAWTINPDVLGHVICAVSMPVFAPGFSAQSLNWEQCAAIDKAGLAAVELNSISLAASGAFAAARLMCADHFSYIAAQIGPTAVGLGGVTIAAASSLAALCSVGSGFTSALGVPVAIPEKPSAILGQALADIRDGWAGDESMAPGADIVDDAKAVLELIGPNVKFPQIEVDDSTGNLSLSWTDDSKRCLLSLTFTGQHRVIGTLSGPRGGIASYKPWKLNISETEEIASKLQDYRVRLLLGLL